jgi:tetratricopeptide (TPR) repeat protein
MKPGLDKPGLDKRGLGRLLTLTVLLSAAVLQAQPPAQEGQLDGSQPLFTVLAAINAAGYDAALDSNGNSPIRKQVSQIIVGKHLDSVEALKKFIANHHQENADAELSQYISFALSLKGPPDFQFWLPPQEIPPDVHKLDGLNELLANFYQEAGIENLWKQAQPALNGAIEAYHGGITQAVLETNAYLRNPTSGMRGRIFQVYVDLLGTSNLMQTRSYRERYFVVVTPAVKTEVDQQGNVKMEYVIDSLQIDQVRHAYLHFLLDPLSLRFFEQWNRDKGLADFAQAAPALDESYKNDFMLLATECVIKAVESRLAHGAQKQALVSEALGQGFVLTPALAEGLAVYEKQPESLRIYFPDLLGQVDLEREDRRLQKVEFARDPTVHKAKAAPPPPEPVLSAPAKGLAAAEDLYAKHNLEGAQEGYRNLLQQPAENSIHARAYYGLARIAALDHDPELAEKLFQKTLEMSPDDETKSWAHLYLGRLSDAAGEREQAEQHYRAALAVHEVPAQVKAAAEKGLAQPFQK